VIGILEFNSFLAGTGYPTGKNTRAGTGMGKILYPRVYMGNPTDRIFFDGYGYGMVLPDGYVPVAIPNRGPARARHREASIGCQTCPKATDAGAATSAAGAATMVVYCFLSPPPMLKSPLAPASISAQILLQSPLLRAYSFYSQSMWIG
jgi:hypothetical protein